ncbi:MAG: four helix bundle protein [Bacteroidota bacterium]
MRNYKNFDVWKEGICIVKKIYQLTNYFPKSEVFGLQSQMRRAAVSVPSNIAEGSSRNSEKEFKRFLEIALGSLFELETQLILSNELNYLEQGDLKETSESITLERKRLISFIKRLK